MLEASGLVPSDLEAKTRLMALLDLASTSKQVSFAAVQVHLGHILSNAYSLTSAASDIVLQEALVLLKSMRVA